MQKVLMLEGQFQDKVWGGERLKTDFGFDINSDSVGEYWAISAMPEASSVVTNGKLSGKSLDEIYRNHKELFGNTNEDTFPLLVKIIDAKDDLSIQVHPDDEMGARLENSLGKTECWYILNENDASIIYGLNADSKEEAVELINEARWDEVLKEVPATKGDFFFVPAGTVHAIKAGCLILEIQQASDVTYRLYDYDRPDKDGNLRELHIEKSIEAIKLNKVNDNQKEEEFDTYKLTTLTSNDFFEVRKYEVHGKVEFTREKEYLLESVIEGYGTISLGDESYDVKKGDFLIITNEASDYTLDGDFTMVEANVLN